MIQEQKHLPFPQLYSSIDMKAKTIFVTVNKAGSDNLFDYPQNIPLPRTGERVIFNDICGIVSQVNHVISDDVAEIRINLIND